MFHSRKNHVSPEGRSISVTFYLKPLKNDPTDSSVVVGKESTNEIDDIDFDDLPFG